METEAPNEGKKHQFMELLCIINRKWAILVVTAIGNFDGVRFNALRKELETISPKTLSNTIKELEAIGIVESVRYPGPPLRIQYFLTSDGKALRNSIIPILKWFSDKSSACELRSVKNAIEE